MNIVPEFMNVCKPEQPQRAFWIQARDLAPCKGGGSFHVLSVPEKGRVCFLPCKCSCLSLHSCSRAQALLHQLLLRPFVWIHSAFQQPPATQQHITHPAQPPLSPGGKGSVLTLQCYWCSRWSPPPTSMPARHTQSWEHQHHGNYFPTQKSGSFVS